ncbi:UNVERIFIED_CONTAM: hypothetical protein FKN15_049470 [Acipenser sinensis]
MNTRCPPKRVPSADRFFTLCRLTVQPPQSYSVGGQRSPGHLTGKPAGARPDYRGRWCAVREATSNDPWGPSSSLMSEIADLTYNVVAFSEIMSMVWKRLNDHGKNWRHVTFGASSAPTLSGVSASAPLAGGVSGGGGVAGGVPGDPEQAWPQSSGEEDLQLQLALAMSKEEAEQSSLMDLANVFPASATSVSPADPWGGRATQSQAGTDPWGSGGVAISAADPWGSGGQPVPASHAPTTSTDPWGESGGAVSKGDPWSSTAMTPPPPSLDPWGTPACPPQRDPWSSEMPPSSDPWGGTEGLQHRNGTAELYSVILSLSTELYSMILSLSPELYSMILSLSTELYSVVLSLSTEL